LLDLGAVMNFGGDGFHFNTWRSRFDRVLECAMIRLIGIQKYGDPINERRQFLENLHPFCGDRRIQIGETGDVSARPRIIADKGAADRIGHLHKDNGHSICELL
jgi:hypothetical protein